MVGHINTYNNVYNVNNVYNSSFPDILEDPVPRKYINVIWKTEDLKLSR